MFDQAKADAICARLEEGESLRSAAAIAGVAPSSFIEWVKKDEALAEQYAQARARGADAEFDALQDLADEQPPVTEKGGIDSGWVAWQRNRIDVRKWTLARKAPKKYGDKIDLNHSGGIKFERIEAVVVDPAG